MRECLAIVIECLSGVRMFVRVRECLCERMFDGCDRMFVGVTEYL